jgi:hypothetical protein
VINVREFDGSGDYVEFATGSIGGAFNDGTHGWTLLALAKPVLAGNVLNLLALGGIGGGTYASIYLATDGEIRIGTDNPSFNGLSSLHAVSGQWQLFAVTQPTGNGTPRLHRCPLGGAWQHANNTTGSFGTTTTGLLVNYFGRFRNGGGDYFGRQAVGAYWPRGLADAQLETIVNSSAQISETPGGAPTELWELGTSPITNLIGSAAQVSVSGTAVVSEDVPWTYGLAPPPEPPAEIHDPHLPTDARPGERPTTVADSELTTATSDRRRTEAT